MNEQAPRIDTLPPTRKLLRSTGIALLVAALLLVVIVLPAEYGIDPTRIGGLLGLTEMGEIKTSLEAESQLAPPPCTPVACAPAPAPAPAANAPVPAAPVANAPPPAPADAAKGRNDVTVVTLEPGASTEVKLAMKEGARVTFDWSSDSGGVNFDLHADNPAGGFQSYKKGVGAATDNGELVAAFDGNHGWYWRNRTDAAVTITLTTTGDYQGVVRSP